MDHQGLYKIKSNFESSNSRLKTFQAKCHQKRLDIFQHSRIITESPAHLNNEKENTCNTNSDPNKNKILTKIEKSKAYHAKYLAWKKEKDKRKMEEKIPQKKLFCSTCSKSTNNHNKKLSSLPLETVQNVTKKLEKQDALKQNINGVNKNLIIKQHKKPINKNNVRSPQKKPRFTVKKQATIKIPSKMIAEELVIPMKNSIIQSKAPTTSKILKNEKETFIEPIKIKAKPSIQFKMIAEEQVIPMKNSVIPSKATTSKILKNEKETFIEPIKIKAKPSIPSKMIAEELVNPMKNSIIPSKAPTTSKILKNEKEIFIEPIKIKAKSSSKSKKKLLFPNKNESKSIIIENSIENPPDTYKIVTSTQRKNATATNLIKLDETAISPIDYIEDIRTTGTPIKLNKTLEENYWPSPIIAPRKSLLSSTLTNNYLSPYVSTSRGKVSVKKEKEKRESVYLLENTSPEEESITKRRMKEAVRRFNQLLNDETERLQNLCNDWNKYIHDNINILNENGGIDMIDATLGQTQLLLKKKFKHFQQLIEKSENYILNNKISENEKPIYAEDLEGFWCMIGTQVDDIDKRFNNINKWKENNWIDPDEINQKIKKLLPNSIVCKKPKKNTIKSTNHMKGFLKKFIKEKNKLNTQADDNDIIFITKNKQRESLTSNKENTPLRRSNRIHSNIICTPKNEGIDESASKIKRKSMTPGQNQLKKGLTPRKSISSEWKCVNLFKKPKEMNTTPLQLKRKSILKTPGTLRKKLNVIFSENLELESPEQQITRKSKLNLTAERKRSLRLRSRILNYDPDATVDIPK